MTARQPLLITVALCTHNRAQRLGVTLKALSSLQAPDQACELLVVDNGSTDETPSLLADTAWHPAWCAVRVVEEPRLGIAFARNRAVEEAHGKYVLFLDDDETAEPDWIRRMEARILETGADALGGRIEVMFVESPRPCWVTDELLGFLGKLDHGPSMHRIKSTEHAIYTGNAAFLRDTVRKLGGFDNTLGRRGHDSSGGEDVDLFRRLIAGGFHVEWVNDAVIHHRIQSWKLQRSYFRGLHYKQGCMEGRRSRGTQGPLPPRYLFPQLARAVARWFNQWLHHGYDSTLRKEMNVCYFAGYIAGWVIGSNRTPVGER